MPKKTPVPKTAATPAGRIASHDRIDTERAALEHRVRELEKAHAEIDTRARKIAHDLNNMLTGVVGYHELIAELLPADDQAKFFLIEARNSCLRARTLVEQLGTLGQTKVGPTSA